MSFFFAFKTFFALPSRLFFLWGFFFANPNVVLVFVFPSGKCFLANFILLSSFKARIAFFLMSKSNLRSLSFRLLFSAASLENADFLFFHSFHGLLFLQFEFLPLLFSLPM